MPKKDEGFKPGDIVLCTKGTGELKTVSGVMTRGMIGVFSRVVLADAARIVEVAVPRDGGISFFKVFEANIRRYDDTKKQHRPIRLFVWQGTDVLPEYTGGIAFALAYTKEQAQRRIIASYPSMLVNDEWSFLEGPPDIYNNPTGFTVRGSN